MADVDADADVDAEEGDGSVGGGGDDSDASGAEAEAAAAARKRKSLKSKGAAPAASLGFGASTLAAAAAADGQSATAASSAAAPIAVAAGAASIVAVAADRGVSCDGEASGDGDGQSHATGVGPPPAQPPTPPRPTIQTVREAPRQAGLEFELNGATQLELGSDFGGIRGAGKAWKMFVTVRRARAGTQTTSFPKMELRNIDVGAVYLAQPPGLLGLVKVVGIVALDMVNACALYKTHGPTLVAVRAVPDEHRLSDRCAIQAGKIYYVSLAQLAEADEPIDTIDTSGYVELEDRWMSDPELDFCMGPIITPSRRSVPPSARSSASSTAPSSAATSGGGSSAAGGSGGRRRGSGRGGRGKGLDFETPESSDGSSLAQSAALKISALTQAKAQLEQQVSTLLKDKVALEKKGEASKRTTNTHTKAIERLKVSQGKAEADRDEAQRKLAAALKSAGTAATAASQQKSAEKNVELGVVRMHLQVANAQTDAMSSIIAKSTETMKSMSGSAGGGARKRKGKKQRKREAASSSSESESESESESDSDSDSDSDPDRKSKSQEKKKKKPKKKPKKKKPKKSRK